MKVSLCAVLALLIAPAAFAEMPDYNVKAHCKQVASFGGPQSEVLLQSCYQMEQSAYDELKPSWDELPAPLRAHCTRVAAFGGPGSFALLQSCVQMESQSATDNDKFQFKR